MAIQDDVTGLQHVGIPTNDVEGTMKFYESLGFKKAGLFKFDNDSKNDAFMRLGNLTIETWDGDPTAKEDGAINHISLNTPDIEKAFSDAKEAGLNLVDKEIQTIPTFWKNGIKYFNI